jgi:hypothetical protein
MNDETKPQKILDKSFSLTRAEQSKEFGAAPPPDAEKRTDPNTPRCRGCGGYHGGVNPQLLCLRRALDQKDGVIKALNAEIVALQTRLRLERLGPETLKEEIPSSEPERETP